jgi:hypothetical protein
VLFGVSLLLAAVLVFGLLLAYPTVSMAFAPAGPAPSGLTDELSGHREKVLHLLETGRITAEESSELLNALGHSVPPRAKEANELEVSPARKLVLVGAALLLLGFFLPWFSINTAAVANEMASRFQQSAGLALGPRAVPNVVPNVGTVQVRGGDLAHRLGWWILALGVGAAVLPFFATTLSASMQRKTILAALGIGVFLLVYAVSGSLRFVSIGVVLAMGGLAMEAIGTVRANR